MTAVDAPGLSYSSASGRWVLAVSVLGSGIAALDATVVNIALPTIGRDFGTGVAAGSSYVLYVLPAIVVFGLGLAITVAPLTATAMSSAPADHAGIASAVNNDVARFGGLLAVAILPALAGS